MRGLPAAFAFLVLLVVVAGCGGSTETGPEPSLAAPITAVEPTSPPESVSERVASLPGAVRETRDAIVEAAHAFDYDRLATLIDPATFSYSFGESGDPVGYWRALEEEGEVPVLGDFLPVVLSMPYARQDDVYVWPSVQAKAPEVWTPQDVAPLRQLYSEEEIEAFRQAGGYLGWRVGIREDGAWLFFVAGD